MLAHLTARRSWSRVRGCVCVPPCVYARRRILHPFYILHCPRLPSFRTRRCHSISSLPLLTLSLLTTSHFVRLRADTPASHAFAELANWRCLYTGLCVGGGVCGCRVFDPVCQHTYTYIQASLIEKKTVVSPFSSPSSRTVTKRASCMRARPTRIHAYLCAPTRRRGRRSRSGIKREGEKQRVCDVALLYLFPLVPFLGGWRCISSDSVRTLACSK